MAWLNNMVAVAASHQARADQPARCTSRRATRERTPCRPWCARKAADVSQPTVEIAATIARARLIGNPQPTTEPGSEAPGAGPCHQLPAIQRPPSSPAVIEA